MRHPPNESTDASQGPFLQLALPDFSASNIRRLQHPNPFISKLLTPAPNSKPSSRKNGKSLKNPPASIVPFKIGPVDHYPSSDPTLRHLPTDLLQPLQSRRSPQLNQNAEELQNDTNGLEDSGGTIRMRQLPLDQRRVRANKKTASYCNCTSIM